MAETLKDPEQRKTLNMKEILQTRLFIRKNCQFARKLDPRISVLVLQGANDRVLKPKSAQRVFARANSDDKDMVTIANCGHVLLGTCHVRPQVTSAITDFVNDRSTRQAVASR